MEGSSTLRRRTILVSLRKYPGKFKHLLFILAPHLLHETAVNVEELMRLQLIDRGTK